MRLFVAVTPPEEIRHLLVRRYMDIERAKWVTMERLHVTLRFLGEVDDAVAERIRSHLREVASTGAPFEIRVSGVGTFGRPARVLWAGIEPPEGITRLATAVEEAVVRAGVSPESRAFSPHLTLARLKQSPPVMVRRFLEHNRGLDLPPFSVRDFRLYSSVLSPSGPTYRPLEAYPLAGAA